MILHTFRHSPHSHTRMEQCIERLNDNDGLLLIEDAVYAVSYSNDIGTKLESLHKLFVLKEDLVARGLANKLDNCVEVDYAQFVELTLSFDSVISW